MGKRACLGIATGAERWLEDVVERIGPAGHFLEEVSTVHAVRGGEWYIGEFGIRGTFEDWEAAGRPTLLAEAREKVGQILATHEPLPLDEDVERELALIEERARAEG